MTTSMAELATALARHLGADRARIDVPLAPLTTLKVGGPADLLVDVRDVDEIAMVVRAAAVAGVPVSVIGGGSNLLIADAGVRGIVLRLAMTTIAQPSSDRVRADAGVTMNGLVRWTIGRGLSALEAWAGTPGTVGGAIAGNAHYGGRNIGELVARVAIVARDGGVLEVPASAMAFGYDTSRVQKSGEVVVWAEFGVGAGLPEALRAVARRSLADRKRTQPLASQSAGCIFQNPDPLRDVIPPDVPASAGALIDRAGLKGQRIGGAIVSPMHANFIVNAGDGSAADVAALIALARRTVRERFGVELRDEVVRLGDFGTSD
jgi:UDP-N-acetylmuramate dehydrogenase